MECNKKQEDGQLRIKFSIGEFALIVLGLIPIALMLVLYFAKAPTPFYYGLALYPVLYFILLFVLYDQSEKFKSELRKFENEGEQPAA